MVFFGKRVCPIAAIGLFVCIFSLGGFISASFAAPDVRVGSIAPDFELKTFEGKKIRLSDEIGKHPIMLVFWSYFCFPCQKEMQSLEELYRELAPEKLSIMGICLDGPEFDSKVLPFLKKNDITFPNAYDINGSNSYEISDNFGVIGTPTIYLLDMKGRVRLIHLGRLNPDILKSLLDDIESQTFCAEIIRPDRPAPVDEKDLVKADGDAAP